MKKRILAATLLLLVLLGMLFIYFFIPAEIELKAEKEVNVTQPGLRRMLLDNNNVKKWWPGDIKDDELAFHGYTYKLHDLNIALLPVLIHNREMNSETQLLFIPLPKGGLRLAWVAKLLSPYNPVSRVKTWLQAMRLQKDMNVILDKLKPFYEKPENIYGIRIKEDLVRDTVLISTGAITQGVYPDNKFIYGLIAKLKTYAAQNNIQPTGFPMLNIDSIDNVDYNIRVALPVATVLPGRHDIVLKRMPGRGNILVTEVTGGPATAQKAFNQIILYARDHQRSSPGIPFYSLVTDRNVETDTTKWVTKIYCPVM